MTILEKRKIGLKKIKLNLNTFSQEIINYLKSCFNFLSYFQLYKIIYFEDFQNAVNLKSVNHVVEFGFLKKMFLIGFLKKEWNLVTIL